jgi:hydroxymethylglutaryl-CoA lyase
MFERMGVQTGLDIGALLDLRHRIAGCLPGEPLNGVPWKAGLAKTRMHSEPTGTA